MSKNKISIIIPCYNEEESIPLHYAAMKKQMKDMNYCDFEIIYVNDGSKDNSLEEMRNLAKKDERVRYISFSRNFGKEAAMYAGLQSATGDYIAIMDADLQDPPELLPKMYRGIIENGYDCVATKSTSRNGYSPLRKIFTKMFYYIIGKLSKTEMVPGARDYRLMTRKMLNAILDMKEYNRYTKGIYSFVGFDVDWIDFENQERIAGYTKWNFWNLFIYAIEGIIGYSTRPLLFPIYTGLLTLFISFICFIWLIVNVVNSYDILISLITTLVLFTSSMNLISLGIVSGYISKTYQESKKRPVYIVKETEEDLKNKSK